MSYFQLNFLYEKMFERVGNGSKVDFWPRVLPRSGPKVHIRTIWTKNAIRQVIMNFGEKQTLLQIRLHFSPKFRIAYKIAVLICFQIVPMCTFYPDSKSDSGPKVTKILVQNSTILIWNCIEHLAFWF